MVFVTNATPGCPLIAATTSSILTVEEMFVPQWQTKTPIRGSSPATSVSGGSSFLTTSVPRASASSAIAPPATALPCITVSGMSFGPW